MQTNVAVLRWGRKRNAEMEDVLTSTGAITINPVATDNPPATSFKSNSQDDVLNAK